MWSYWWKRGTGLSIRNIERHVADHDRENRAPYLPPCAEDTGRRVAVVGGGPAGLAAAYFLRLAGHAVDVIERRDILGGRLRHAHDEQALPRDVLDAELGIVQALGATVRCGTNGDVAALAEAFDAVVVAAAAVEGASASEGVFLAGDERPFSGVVTGEAREGYRRVRCAYKKQYVKGVLHGKSYYWYPNGKLESVEPYKNGKLHGIVTRYYDTGKIKAKIHFVKGLRGGLHGEVFWDKDGHIMG